jgi:hypothetical protein
MFGSGPGNGMVLQMKCATAPVSIGKTSFTYQKVAVFADDSCKSYLPRFSTSVLQLAVVGVCPFFSLRQSPLRERRDLPEDSAPCFVHQAEFLAYHWSSPWRTNSIPKRWTGDPAIPGHIQEAFFGCIVHLESPPQYKHQLWPAIATRPLVVSS